jgi:tRNA modification GTPase
MYIHDTIAAISTPIGEGGIGIIRVSGSQAVAIVEQLFRRNRNGGLSSHRFYYGTIVEPATGEVLDEVMLVAMLAPRSYTCEDVVEIHCHGGYLLVQKVLALVIGQGARLAQPGEFTQRAFLNGRIDLLQAEAVIDLIRGKTDAALTLAQHQRQGLLSQRIAAVKQDVLYGLALVEAYIDFPEEDLGAAAGEEIGRYVGKALAQIEALLAGFDEGRVLREGVAVLIAGKPNVGKSSLLNTLLQEQRVIVTSVPGTTRDIIEEIVNINGLPVRMLDTAGIRASEDIVEQEGVRRTIEQIPLADLVLFLLDASRPFDEEDRQIAETLASHRFLVVTNKADLPPLLQLPASLASAPFLSISTQTGAGIAALREMIFATFLHGTTVDRRELVALSQARHRDALLKARGVLLGFQNNFAAQLSSDLLAVDLHEALRALGEVTGDTTPDEVLDLIFQRFCIGK